MNGPIHQHHIKKFPHKGFNIHLQKQQKKKDLEEKTGGAISLL